MTSDTALENLNAVPIEALEELADAWEDMAELSGVGIHQIAYERAATELREVIADYEA